MHTRISTLHHIDLLKAGTLLIQYPLEGAPAELIDLSDPESFLKYEVCAIEADNIKLKPPRAAVNCEPIPAATHGDATAQLSVREMPAAQLISDGNWWIDFHA